MLVNNNNKIKPFAKSFWPRVPGFVSNVDLTVNPVTPPLFLLQNVLTSSSSWVLGPQPQQDTECSLQI
jgi:hypothetical protein